MRGEERDDARCDASGEVRDEARRGERPAIGGLDAETLKARRAAARYRAGRCS